MMGWRDGWSAGAWLAMALLMLVFWTLVVVAVFAAMRGTRTSDRLRASPALPPDDALRILDARLARGEIDAAEYSARRELLQSR